MLSAQHLPPAATKHTWPVKSYRVRAHRLSGSGDQRVLSQYDRYWLVCGGPLTLGPTCSSTRSCGSTPKNANSMTCAGHKDFGRNILYQYCIIYIYDMTRCMYLFRLYHILSGIDNLYMCTLFTGVRMVLRGTRRLDILRLPAESGKTMLSSSCRPLFRSAASTSPSQLMCAMEIQGSDTALLIQAGALVGQGHRSHPCPSQDPRRRFGAPKGSAPSGNGIFTSKRGFRRRSGGPDPRSHPPARASNKN